MGLGMVDDPAMEVAKDTSVIDFVETMRRASALPLALAVAAVVSDCLTALPPLAVAAGSVPTSFRGTSIVLVACLAAAPTARRAGLVLQLALVSASLVLVSIVGLHEGSALLRAFDAFFVTCVAGIIAVCLLTSSTLLRKRMHTHHRASPPVVACLAILVYAGLRAVRNAIFMCTDVSSRTFISTIDPVSSLPIVVSGCTLCNALAAGALAAAGASASVSCAIVLFRSTSADAANTQFDVERAIVPLAAGASAQAVAVLTGLMAFAHTAGSLDSIFGPDACSSNADQCIGAREMRRLNAVAHGLPTSLLAALATASLISKLSGIGDRTIAASGDAEVVRSKRRGRRAVYALVSCACIYAVTIVLWYAEWDSWYSHTEVASLLALVGIACSAVWSTQFGTMLLFLSSLVEVGIHLGLHARALAPFATYLTVISNTILLMLFLLLSVIDVVAAITQHCFRTSASSSLLEGLSIAGTIVCTSGRSIAFFLMVGSVGLLASYDGGTLPMRQGANAEQRTAFAFIVWHFVPAAAWMSASYQYSTIGNLWGLLAAWILPTAGVVTIYTVVLGAVGTGMPVEYPTHHVSNMVAAAVGIVLPPWIAAMR
jgi:hypothetical protein